jgi:hypothetical protein
VGDYILEIDEEIGAVVLGFEICVGVPDLHVERGTEKESAKVLADAQDLVLTIEPKQCGRGWPWLGGTIA